MNKKAPRKAKTCHHCGKTVMNLSRHKMDVHSMSKLGIQLDEYVSGKKNAPKRKVKFCPLSPCKYKVQGVFQLNKHLQSKIHGMKPNTNAYLETLRNASRASIEDANKNIKNLKRQKKKMRRDKKRQGADLSLKKRKKSDKDGAVEKMRVGKRPRVDLSDDKSNESDTDVVDKKRPRVDLSDDMSNDSNKDSVVKEIPRVDLSDDMSNESDKDDVVKERMKNGKRPRVDLSKDVAVKCDAGSLEKDSDNEYEKIAEKAWTGKHKQESKHLEGLHKELMDDIVSETSEESDDTYKVSKSSKCSSESSETTSTVSTCPEQEKEDLLTELVEMTGEMNCLCGSQLDGDLPWKREVLKFIEQKNKTGYAFKEDTDSKLELRKLSKELKDYDEKIEWLDDSYENDEDLDEDWEQMDEVVVEETISTTSESLLHGFYTWLVGVDGGYRNEKIASQYKAQVNSVLCKLQLSAQKNDGSDSSNLSGVELLTLEGKEGVELLREWLSCASEQYQPGTVRSYLMSLRLFLKYLVQEQKLNCIDVLNARRDLLSSWSGAQKKKVLKRKLEKYDEDYLKVLSGPNLHKVCNGSQRVNTIKQLGNASEKNNSGEEAPVLMNDQKYCEVRDWLITRVLIDNSGRSGIAANMTVKEFNDAKLYPGDEEDGERYRVLVSNHKTANVYGAAVVWMYTDLYKLVDMFIKYVRTQFLKNNVIQQVFISSNGQSITSSQVSNSVWRTFQREGIDIKGRISATTIRKSIATGIHVHLPDQQEQLAALAQHKVQTQASYYRVHDKVKETDLGRRAVNKYVAMNTNSQVDVQYVEWTVQEINHLKSLFDEEIKTGNISKSSIEEKLGASSLLQSHTAKAIVLKVKRLRTEFMSNVLPPTEEEGAGDKVRRYLFSSDDPDENETTKTKASSQSSRMWSKFTEEQTQTLFSLSHDMIASNAVKRETVWQRVSESEKARQVGLTVDFDDEEELTKHKQRLVDKVRQEARKRKIKSKKNK